MVKTIFDHNQSTTYLSIYSFTHHSLIILFSKCLEHSYIYTMKNWVDPIKQKANLGYKTYVKINLR